MVMGYMLDENIILLIFILSLYCLWGVFLFWMCFFRNGSNGWDICGMKILYYEC